MPTELEKELRPLGINIQEMIEAPGSARDLLGDSLEMKAFSNHLIHLHHDIEKRFPGHGGALEQFERDIFKALGRLDRNMRKLNVLEKGIHPKRWAHVQGFLLPRGAKQERRLAWAQILKNPEHLEDIAHVFSDPFDFRHRIYA
jgi:hypothetical protein